MTVTIYHHPACGTSRNVLGLIRNSGEKPRIIEYLKTPASRDELASLIERMGIPVRDVVRRKGTPYDAFRLADPALTDDQLLDAMMAHPILINRPLVVTQLGVKLCRPSETVRDILPNAQRSAFAKEGGALVVDAHGRRVTNQELTR
ncbi:MAG: arsenate reductase (glutaredoxin) [Pseudomonadota bacterium]|nr:arsenate reductase (glutaredoxin) [Pseudomonadota bacterium]